MSRNGTNGINQLKRKDYGYGFIIITSKITNFDIKNAPD